MEVAAGKPQVNAGENDLHACGMNVRGSHRLGATCRIDENLGISTHLDVSDAVSIQGQVAGSGELSLNVAIPPVELIPEILVN